MIDDDDIWDDPTRDDYPCDHEDYEADILTGIATCDHCGHRWMQTHEEVEREIRHIARYQEWQDREVRRQWWRDLRDWFLAFIPRRKRTIVSDDDIPF